MTRLAVVIPTLPGREYVLQRSVTAYRLFTPYEVKFFTELGPEPLGVKWQRGGERAVEWGADYIHLTCDDHEPHPRWTWDAVPLADAGYLPAAVIEEQSGFRHVWSDQLPPDLTVADPKDFAQCPSVPLMSARQWEQIQPMCELQYCLDWWVRYRGDLAGFRTVVCASMVLTHIDGQVGKVPGRLERDTRAFYELIS